MRIFSIPGSEAIVSIERCNPSRSLRSMYSVVPCLITSLMRSATSSVFCSRCCRCTRTLTYPIRAKITIIALSNSRFSFRLSVCLMRSQRSRFGSVSGMLQHPRCHRDNFRCLGYGLTGELSLRENRQIFHRQPEEREASADDHSRDRQFAPLGEVAHPGRSLETRDAYVHAICDESEHH